MYHMQRIFGLPRIILLLYLINILFLSLEIGIYPGIINNRIGINPFWLFGLFAIIVSIYIYRYDSGILKQIPSFLPSINSFLIFGSLVLLAAFSILKQLNYPNYVFDTFGIYHHYLLILFLAGYAMYMAIIGQKKIIAQQRWQIFLLSVVALTTIAFLFSWPNDFFAWISMEDGVYENIQFALFLLAGIIFGQTALNHYRLGLKHLAVGFALCSLFWLFVAKEEISWGQRVFNLEIESIQETSTKDEINLHNQEIIQQFVHPAYRAIALYGMFSFLFIGIFVGKLPDLKWLRIGPEHFLFFLGLYLAYTLGQRSGLPEYRIYYEESAELLLSISVFLIALQKRAKVQKLLGSNRLAKSLLFST